MTQRVFRFGSRELEELHQRAWELFVVEKSNGSRVIGRRIRWEYDGFQYVVDHGSHRTLNTMTAGQCAVRMEDV